MENQLIKVPSFTFKQGEMFVDEKWEQPIEIRYWDGGTIELYCDGHSINVHEDYLQKLFTAIKKNLPEAKQFFVKK